MTEIKNLRITHPNLFALLMALATASFAWAAFASGFLPNNDGDHFFRIALLAAIPLISFDKLETTYIGHVHPEYGEPLNRWYHAFYLGYIWAVWMILLSWPGAESAAIHIATWSVAGGIFGLLMMRAPLAAPMLTDRYDLETDTTLQGLGWIYYGLPFIIIAFLVLYPASAGAGAGDFNERFYLLQLVLMGGLACQYPLRKKWSRDAMPVLIGSACLVVALVWL